jgi:hypothetical protein
VRSRAWVGAVAAAFTLTACGSDDANPLFANAWILTSAVDHGAQVEVPQGSEIRWRFLKDGGCGDRYTFCPDGPRLVGNDVCNDFARSFQVDGDQVVWGDDWWSSAVGCPRGLTDTLQDFFLVGSIRYVVADDQLRLTSSDDTVRLTLRASDAT